MKKLFAILAIGLFLATALSGCVGAEKKASVDDSKNDGVLPDDGNQTATGNETTANATSSNETGIPRVETIEFTGTATGVWAGEYLPPDSGTKHEFNVEKGATMLVVTVTWDVGDVDFKVYDAKGSEAGWADAIDPSAGSEQITIEDKAAFKKAGTWTLEVLGAIAVQTAYTATIEIHYFGAQ